VIFVLFHFPSRIVLLDDL